MTTKGEVMARKRTQIDIAKALREWRTHCPLTLWRKESGVSRENAASFAGISYNTWTHWEMGSSQPSSENMQRLVGLTGDPELVAKWQTWWAQKPTL
jgi:transcriptional regulator with XRE-family HTH domain